MLRVPNGTGVSLDASSILRLRLANQHLVQPELSDPAALVAHQLAVQSQDLPWARWGLGQRLDQATNASIERAFDAGLILRTHVLRPTWHFVTPADIRWLLDLTAPRIKTALAIHRRGIEAGLFARVNAALERLLEGGQAMTRTELRRALLQLGMTDVTAENLGPLLLWAELDGIICSGPRAVKQTTYALLAERAPAGRRLERDEALAELTLRYFASHGPATLRDCSWWSGQTMVDIRRGVEQVSGQLEQASVGGLTYWFAPGAPPPMPERVYLLPNFDEYTVAFRDRDLYYDATRGQSLDKRPPAPFDHAIVIRGRVEGVWRRTFAGARMTVQAKWFDPPTQDLERALQCEVKRMAGFYGVQAQTPE